MKQKRNNSVGEFNVQNRFPNIEIKTVKKIKQK